MKMLPHFLLQNVSDARKSKRTNLDTHTFKLNGFYQPWECWKVCRKGLDEETNVPLSGLF
jgi:hypothetical protein